MRIALVSEPVLADGLAPHLAALSQALGQAAHRVTRHIRPTEEELPEFARELAGEWSRRKPAVAHAHGWRAGLAALLAARQVTVPVAVSGESLRGAGREFARVARLVCRAADQVLAGCADDAVDLARLGVPRDRMSIVPGGVDAARFQPGGPVDSRGARHRLVSVGPLTPDAGFDQIVAVLRTLPDTELVIAGSPTLDPAVGAAERARLARAAAANGVGDRVRLTTEVEDLAALLRSADLVVRTPWRDPFGAVALAAMACGVPVVASAVGGLADAVVEGVTGLQVPPRNPAALRHALVTLLSDDVRRAAMGLASRDRALSRYAWTRVAEETVRAYQAAGDHPAPALAGTD